MATLKKFNLAGDEIGEVEIEDGFANFSTSAQLIKDYIVAIRRNARQWSANTKERWEVSHSTAKPHPQKGTGRARQGSLAAPQYKGGGVVFGPKPKFNQHVKINRRERKAALKHLIAERMREGAFIVLEDSVLDAPSTKTASKFLKSVQSNKRVLILADTSFAEIGDEEMTFQVAVGSNKHHNLAKSFRNIQKVRFSTASAVSGYDVGIAGTIIATEAALEELKNWLGDIQAKGE